MEPHQKSAFSSGRIITMRASLTILTLALALPAGVALAADPLKVGILLPTTGVFAPVAKEQLNGFQLAVEEAGGEVAGRPLQLIIEDTEGKPDVGLAKARKLVISERADVLAGIVSSAVALAVAPYTSSQKVPLVISNASANAITGEKCDRYVLRVAPSSAQVTRPMGVYLAKNGIKNVFIMASDFVAPREYVEAFKDGYLSGGGTVAGEVFPPFNRTQDYGPYIAQAKASNPSAIFAVFFGGEAVLFTKQYQSFGMSATPLYSGIGLTPPMLHAAEGDAALGVVSSVNYTPDLTTAGNADFVAAYQKKFGILPAEFAVMAYESMRLIIEGVKARGGDTKDRAALAAALEKSSFVGPRGPIKIDPQTHGATQNFYIVKTVKRGDRIGFETLETFPEVVDPVKGCVMK
jgi:branched-chain amino acid transport system substrate-binding protein